MYIQITTRCNMECAHCCFSCTSKGTDMSLSTFKKACDFSGERGECISIGGGEPTLHKQLWQFIGYALGRAEEHRVWLATNGKRTDDAIRLAEMARLGILAVTLSADDGYHECIDSRVLKAFDRNNKSPHDYPYDKDHMDYRELRKVTRIIAAGRARNIRKAVKDCPCSETFITPNGDIFLCGCCRKKIGNVHQKEEIVFPKRPVNDKHS